MATWNSGAECAVRAIWKEERIRDWYVVEADGVRSLFRDARVMSSLSERSNHARPKNHKQNTTFSITCKWWCLTDDIDATFPSPAPSCVCYAATEGV
jgi:hypothetical protein